MTERDGSREQDGPVRFGSTFIGSDAFRELFREGMRLIEETAAFLDGPGRDESRALSQRAALAYASESMRLTTRLMQIASWLLVHRAVAEGEINSLQALQEKSRVRLSAQEISPSVEFEELPERLKDLIELSLRLHARIVHLDRVISDEASAEPRDRSPVETQLGLLRSAFGRTG
jgi:regulator of CtrA degradation